MAPSSEVCRWTRGVAPTFADDPRSKATDSYNTSIWLREHPDSECLGDQRRDALGVTAREIDIRPCAAQMLRDIEHPAVDEPVYDRTYENVQAGERTSHLFRLANRHDGLVVATSDLSELALGWSTYGVGDQMALQRQCIRAQDAGAISHPMDRRYQRTGAKGRRRLRPKPRAAKHSS